jgi:hypothetical protein
VYEAENLKDDTFWTSGGIRRITGFLDLAHRLKFYITRKHNVSEAGSVSVFRGEKGDTGK